MSKILQSLALGAFLAFAIGVLATAQSGGRAPGCLLSITSAGVVLCNGSCSQPGSNPHCEGGAQHFGPFTNLSCLCMSVDDDGEDVWSNTEACFARVLIRRDPYEIKDVLCTNETCFGTCPTYGGYIPVGSPVCPCQ